MRKIVFLVVMLCSLLSAQVGADMERVSFTKSQQQKTQLIQSNVKP